MFSSISWLFANPCQRLKRRRTENSPVSVAIPAPRRSSRIKSQQLNVNKQLRSKLSQKPAEVQPAANGNSDDSFLTVAFSSLQRNAANSPKRATKRVKETKKEKRS